MTLQDDPFRTLGVRPGASVDEIKSAYRRLAKRYHPDTAGERALSRFLAIQAAYERLVDGDGRLRGGRDPWPAGAGPADGARPRASRDAWRARQSAGGSGPAPGTRDPGAAADPGAGIGGNGGGGPRPRDATGDDGGGGGGTDSGRGSRKATPGSTTYDEATGMPLDPEWEGGAWYGPSSGTYWTLNPREYADPRKHGPEYLARARRAAAGEDPADEGPAGEGPAGEDPGAAARARPGAGRGAT